MDGGSFNRIVGLTFASGEHQHCILRIPRFALDDKQPYEISDQISVLLYLSQFDFLKVPSILAYDMTTKNAISSQWVLQARVPGHTLQSVFYDLPLAEKLQITTSVAELVMKLGKIKLDKPGRLIGARSLPQLSYDPPALLKAVKITGFRKNPIQDQPPVKKQHITSLLIAMLENWRQDKEDQESKAMVEKYERLQAIVKEMETAGMMRTRDLGNVLWHWDLSACNILINRFDIAEDNSDDTEKQVRSTDGDTIEISAPPQVQTDPSKICQHSAHFTVDGSPDSGHKHSVMVKVKNDSARSCKHRIRVEIEDQSSTIYRHTLEISSLEKRNGSQKEEPTAIVGVLPEDKEGMQGQPPAQEQKWVITGVLDWDDALSVPLVLARNPQSWLWFDEGERTLSWSGNRDTKPERDLTNDELLIKAHFDQIMAREEPTYIEDTYHRGLWVRALARFALYGFSDSQDWKRYDKFVADWDEYFKSTGLKAEEDVKVNAE